MAELFYDYNFDPAAVNNTAASLYRMARSGGDRILDLGSGPAVVSSQLARDGHYVVCVDLDEPALAAARERGVDRTVVGDLADGEWVEQIAGQQFDTIILADVLEHLVEPWRLIDRIMRAKLLPDDGQLLVSVPNVGHEAVTLGLALGRFRYTPTGLLDATHVRFFTRDSLYGLLESQGFVVRELHRTQRTVEQTEQFQIARDAPQELRRGLRELSPDSMTYQFVVAAVPAAEAGHVAVLRQRLQEERDEHTRQFEQLRTSSRQQLQEARESLASELTRLEGQRDELRDELKAAKAEHRHELTILRDLVTRLEGKAGQAVSERAALESRLAATQDELRTVQRRETPEVAKLWAALRRVEDRLDAVYDSTSFRLGWALTSPARRLRSSQVRPIRPERITPRERGTQGQAHGGRSGSGDADDASGDPCLELRSSLRREIYDREVNRTEVGSGMRPVVFLCSTTDLDAGRGDLYAAIGLGLALSQHGLQGVYLPYGRWHELPEGTPVVVSLLAEESMQLDPAELAPTTLRLAWIRNNTSRWIRSGTLELYDLVLCSSKRTVDEIREHYTGPLELLPLAVDHELFTEPHHPRDRDAVVTTVNQWGRERRTYRVLAASDLDQPVHIYGKANNLDERIRRHHRGMVSYFDIPSLYQQAAIVLDDQQGVNAPYGNVNSRIYEALSAGALPLTCSPLGLEEVGLDDIPTWRDDEELGPLVAYWSTHVDERYALVARLRRKVLEEHTFTHRAERFAHLVSNLRRRTLPVLGFYPDYRKTNPFQDLVYAAAAGRVVRPVQGLAALLDAPGLQDHARVFHLHWVAPLIGPAGGDVNEAARLAQSFLDDLDRARRAGIGIVWTVHNPLTHEVRHPQVERWLRQGIADRADLVHVLSQATIGAVRRAGYELPEDRVWVGTHPSYLGVYPSAVSRSTGRSELGYGQDVRLYLALGQIRPYKGVERLLDSFETFGRRHPSARLLIAGKPGRFEGVSDLLNRARGTVGTTVINEHVPDERLQVLLRAADVVVLPHRRVLNSGLLWLAWTFGRPVVAPATGSLTDLVTKDVGVLFDDDATDLAPALEESLSLGPEHGRVAFARALEAHPFDVSRELLNRIASATDEAGLPPWR